MPSQPLRDVDAILECLTMAAVAPDDLCSSPAAALVDDCRLTLLPLQEAAYAPGDAGRASPRPPSAMKKYDSITGRQRLYRSRTSIQARPRRHIGSSPVVTPRRHRRREHAAMTPWRGARRARSPRSPGRSPPRAAELGSAPAWRRSGADAEGTSRSPSVGGTRRAPRPPRKSPGSSPALSYAERGRR